MDPTLQQGKRLLQWGVAISTLLAAAPLGYLFITNGLELTSIVLYLFLLLGGIPWLTFRGSHRARNASGVSAVIGALIALPFCSFLAVPGFRLLGASASILFALLCFLTLVFLFNRKVQKYIDSVRLTKGLQTSQSTQDDTPENPKRLFTLDHLTGGLFLAGTLGSCLFLLWPFLMLSVGYYRGPHRNSPLLEAHQRAVNSFVASEGFGRGRFGQRPDFWQERTINFEGTEYLVSGLQLLGLTPEFGDRYFTRPFPPKKNHLSEAEHRQLTPEEAEAVAKLRAGEPWVKLDAPPTPEDTTHQIRVIAPLVAQKSCLECHEVKEGTLLGAFDYGLFKHKVFNPAYRKEATETKPDNTSPPDSKESI
ncbi:MAG: hypothetical protein OJI67_12380, partial [Prosthecobacter sp.]|nr:hypothetical protein [Prosthecobacter sp.]